MHKQLGFSLIELMVALMLSSLLLLGLIQTFDASKRSNTMQMAFSRIQETGRIATELIGSDIRMADFWGCLDDTSLIVDHLDPSDADYGGMDPNWLTSDALQITNNVTSTIVFGTGATARTVSVGTDVLTINSSTDACGGLGRTMNSVNAASLGVAPGCVEIGGGPLGEGDIAIVTNCEGGEMFSITNLQAGGGNGSSSTVVHNTGSCTASSNCIDNLTQTFTQSYGSDARILAPVRTSYFVANDDDGTPSLFVLKNSDQPIQLVAGVEDFQLAVGQDTDDDGAVDFLTPHIPTGAGALDNVLSIRTTLIVRDEENVNSSDVDKLLRKRFSSTSTIRNRLL